MELGKKIQHLRELNGFTQEGLAKQTGISQASIARIESGIVADPKVKGILKLSVILGVPVEVLLDDSISIENWQDEIKSFRISDDGKELLKFYRELKKKQKKLLVSFAQLLRHQDYTGPENSGRGKNDGVSDE
jgi:transcriptional regulator with XRE-family HTH domain